MGHYNNATICLNGHVVSKYQAMPFVLLIIKNRLYESVGKNE